MCYLCVLRVHLLPAGRQRRSAGVQGQEQPVDVGGRRQLGPDRRRRLAGRHVHWLQRLRRSVAVHRFHRGAHDAARRNAVIAERPHDAARRHAVIAERRSFVNIDTTSIARMVVIRQLKISNCSLFECVMYELSDITYI